MKKLMTFLLLGSLIFLACDKDDDDDEPMCDSENITYTNTMKEYFDSGCTFSGCHNSGSPQGGLTNYTEVAFFVGFGRIVGALKHEAGFQPMPRNNPMWDECKIEQLEAWIADGIPE